MDSLEQLESLRNNIAANAEAGGAVSRVLVGMATCGMASGAGPVMKAISDEIAKRGIGNVKISQTGCVGVCHLEPIVDIYDPDGRRTMYVHMDPEKAVRVVDEHLLNSRPMEAYSVNAGDILSKQLRIVLRNCGVIDPDAIEDYIARNGYSALGKALLRMTPENVIEEVKKSGIKGRGGAGFPTGMKWQFAANSPGDVKYVVCNADEGDPGAFMDRSVLEGDPHSVIEAMAIAGYAIGARRGFIYVRAEYPVAVKRLGTAIERAKGYGFLGRDIFGSGFDFDLELRLGAGAFVCGEETALMTSIEGSRGEPRPRPPFPAVKGVFAKPTVLNNVETYANIPLIIDKGADWFNKIGMGNSTGTKVFAMGGKINNTGLAEVPIGTTIREIIYGIGGGVPNGRAFKAVQTGGPSGGCIPASELDLKIDYDSLKVIGSMMGSGGFIVMDQDNCMVDIAKFFLGFTVDESCGKCPPCRVGTKRMLEILNRITEGLGEPEDIDKLEKLAMSIKAASLCGLGQTAPNPVLSTLKYFRGEYMAHVVDKKCPAGICKSLRAYVIDSEKCKSCGLCKPVCPAHAISGGKKIAYAIDAKFCEKCGACVPACRFNAISYR